MSKLDQDILTTLKKMLGETGSCFVAMVTDNGKGEDTFTVSDLDGAIYNNVRKRAAEDGKNGLLITPVKNSSVIVGRIGISDQLIAVMYSEIEEVNLTLHNHYAKLDKEGLAIDVSNGKYEIKNSSTSLIKLMTSLYDIISKLTVSTPNGPSGTPLPPTITALEKFKTDFQQLLK